MSVTVKMVHKVQLVLQVKKEMRGNKDVKVKWVLQEIKVILENKD